MNIFVFFFPFQGPSASAYVTYFKSEDALRAIQVIMSLSFLEVCVPECHFPGTRFFPKNPGNFQSWAFRTSSSRSQLSTCIRNWLLPILFQAGKHSGIPERFRIKINNPDFPEQRDHKEVVLSRSRQFGNCPPVTSNFVFFKWSRERRPLLNMEWTMLKANVQ